MAEDSSGWIVLVYRAPASPSKHRVAAWRKLKAAGAVYVQDSVCALPDTTPHRELLGSVAAELRAAGGEALLLVAAGVGPEADQALVAKFNAERDHDYEELGDQCAALVADVEREQDKGRFTFAAVEDTESNLARLRRWIEAIITRDFFAAPGRADAEAELQRAAAAVERFADQVAGRADRDRLDGPDGHHHRDDADRPDEPGVRD